MNGPSNIPPPPSQHFATPPPPPTHQIGGRLMSPVGPGNHLAPPHHGSIGAPSPSPSSSPSTSGTSNPSSPHPHHHPAAVQQQQYYLLDQFAVAAQQQPPPYQNISGHHLSPVAIKQEPSSHSIVPKQDLFLQMQHQYEQQIRALQMELETMKQAMVCFNNNNSPNTSTNTTKKSSKNGHQPHIVETYREEMPTREFCCKNCPYKTKSQASLIIHNTNHLVNQRYLHLPTTVFSASIKSNSQRTDQANGFMYPCGECSGKFLHNELYLHIYQHHTGEYPFHCDECDLFFMHYEFLDDHQRTTHMKHSQNSSYMRANKKARGYDSATLSPQLTYYSVVKYSKPFSSFATNCNNNSSSNSSSSSSSSPWNNQEPAAATYKTQTTQPYPIAFPYVPKRGRGRGAPSVHCVPINRTSSTPAFPSSSYHNLVQNSQSNTSSIHDTGQLTAIIQNQQFKCTYEDCFFQSDTKERLDFHLFAHRNSRFKCPYCPYVSNVLNDIKRHCMKGQKHEGPMFQCPNCTNMQTNCDKTFKDHIRNVHFGKMIDDKTLQSYIENLFRNTTPTPNDPVNNTDQSGGRVPS